MYQSETLNAVPSTWPKGPMEAAEDTRREIEVQILVRISQRVSRLIQADWHAAPSGTRLPGRAVHWMACETEIGDAVGTEKSVLATGGKRQWSCTLRPPCLSIIDLALDRSEGIDRHGVATAPQTAGISDSDGARTEVVDACERWSAG